jgi:thymidine kinase
MKNEFVIFTGPMFGGKTTKLLSAIDRYSYQKQKIFAFKPSLDDRYSTGYIVTHTGGKVSADLVRAGAEIFATVNAYEGDSRFNPRKTAVIAVDEAFMIPGCGETLVSLFRRGHTILASSLQLSSNGQPYEELAAIMPYATKVEVCPAVCTQCGSDAYYTEKVGGRSDHEIEVGGADLYHPRCSQHFLWMNVND